MTKRASVAERLDAAGIGSNGHVASTVEQLLAPADVRVEQISVELLYDHPDNPRGAVGDVDELADSIKASGIFEPLIVVPAEAWQAVDERLPGCEAGDFVIVAGHRRKAAAVQAGMQTVPCVVRSDLVGADAEVAMLVENLQREDLSPIQEARGFAQLEAAGKSQREIARLVGYKQPHVSKRLSLLRLPEEIQAEIGTEDLTIADAVELAKVADDPEVLKEVRRNLGGYLGTDRIVEQVLAKRKKAADLEAEQEKWRTRGVQKIVAYNGWGLGPHDKPRDLEHLAADGVDIAEHEHFACHAMAVGYNYSGQLRAIACCTNPKTHPESREHRESDGKRKADEKRAREQASALKRRAARLATCRELVDGKKIGDDVTAVVTARVLDDVLEQSYDEAEWLALGEVLGITPPPDMDDPELVDHYQGEVERLVASSTTAAGRVMFAAVLVQCESDAEGSWYGGTDNRRRFLKLLQAHGHKLSGPERQVIQEPKQRRDYGVERVEVPASHAPSPESGIPCMECEHGEPDPDCSCEYCYCGTAAAAVDQEHEQLLDASEAVG